MDATIKVDGLHKRFGKTQALAGMTFTVRPGQVTGFIGPNGAGKSTTMRVILGLDAPDAGTATITAAPTARCVTRSATSGRCSTRARCSRAAAGATKQRKDKAMKDAAQQASAAAACRGSGAISIIRAVRWRGRSPAVRMVAISAVLTVMALAAVACSSSSPGSTPDAGSSPVTTAQLVDFAQCMRGHGVKNFPDPVSGGFSFSGVGPDSVDPSSPVFQAAKAACIHLVPGEAQRLTETAQELAAGDTLAACMRSHGFPAFPDPTSQNVFDVPKSINIALPSYQSAFSTCQSQAHDTSGVFPGAASNGQGS